MVPDSGQNEPQVQPATDLLASPVQRLGAALADLGILLGAGLVLMAILLALVPAEKVEGAFLRTATCYSLLYLVVLWGRGQTPGKRIFGIKVVGLDGRPPGLLRGAARYVGYVIASLPFKIGLLAILWDPLRRGWHDRIAGTLVVKEHAPEIPVSPPENEPISADESAPGAIRWRDLVMLPLFLLATALLTWPVIVRVPARFPSDGGDANLFMWNLWWFRKATLDPHLSVWKTDYIFWPETVSTRLHSFSIFNCWLGIPLQRFLSPELTYTVLWVLALSGTAFAAYLVGKYVTGTAAGGFLAGLFFGFCPYMVWHAFGHLDLISSEWAVLYVLLIVVLMKKAQARHALFAGIALALAGLCAWYHLVHMAVFTAAFAAAWLIVHRQQIARRALLAVLAPAIALALLAAWLVPMAREFRSGSYDYERATARARATVVSLDAGSLVTPPPYHPLFGRWTKDLYLDRLRPGTGVEQASYLGFSVLALSMVAVWDRKRRRTYLPWLAVATVCILISFGFRLTVFNYPGLPLWLVLAAGGPPGSGMDLPIVPSLARNVALSLASWSPDRLLSLRAVDTPFALLWKMGGAMRLASAPGRFVQVAYLCLSVLAALGALHLAQRAGMRRGKWAARAVLAAAAAAVMFEYMIAPRFPTEPAAMAPFYNRLAKERDCTAIVEVPTRELGDTHSQRAQAVHGKRLYIGFISRIPDRARRFYRGHPLLSQVLAAGGGPRRGDPHAWLGVRSLGEDALKEPWLSTCRADLRALSRTGCCYIVLHKGSIEPKSLRQAERLLGEALKLPVAFDDREVVAFRVPHQAG